MDNVAFVSGVQQERAIIKENNSFHLPENSCVIYSFLLRFLRSRNQWTYRTPSVENNYSLSLSSR